MVNQEATKDNEIIPDGAADTAAASNAAASKVNGTLYEVTRTGEIKSSRHIWNGNGSTKVLTQLKGAVYVAKVGSPAALALTVGDSIETGVDTGEWLMPAVDVGVTTYAFFTMGPVTGLGWTLGWNYGVKPLSAWAGPIVVDAAISNGPNSSGIPHTPNTNGLNRAIDCAFGATRDAKC